MSTRTVRLDEEAEETLERLRNLTGLSISEVLKRGLSAFESEAVSQVQRTPYEIYRELDLGEGGYAIAPATEAKRAVKDAIRRKRQP
jgi:Arc/MetJ-type ribon-helix-helix transcriptional regulator